jgi:hypothetical protein
MVREERYGFVSLRALTTVLQFALSRFAPMEFRN